MAWHKLSAPSSLLRATPASQISTASSHLIQNFFNLLRVILGGYWVIPIFFFSIVAELTGFALIVADLQWLIAAKCEMGFFLNTRQVGYLLQNFCSGAKRQLLCVAE